MNRRQKKKAGKPCRTKRTTSREGCGECLNMEKCIEAGRGRCTQYKDLKGVQLEIEKLSIGTR